MIICIAVCHRRVQQLLYLLPSITTAAAGAVCFIGSNHISDLLSLLQIKNGLQDQPDKNHITIKAGLERIRFSANGTTIVDIASKDDDNDDKATHAELTLPRSPAVLARIELGQADAGATIEHVILHGAIGEIQVTWSVKSIARVLMLMRPHLLTDSAGAVSGATSSFQRLKAMVDNTVGALTCSLYLHGFDGLAV